jgi:hypothetical protein
MYFGLEDIRWSFWLRLLRETRVWCAKSS